jgi:hypothetical protein
MKITQTSRKYFNGRPGNPIYRTKKYREKELKQGIAIDEEAFQLKCKKLN